MAGFIPIMQPILILMGVSGVGKSTLGKLLAREVGGVFIEGDDFHPPHNVAKMKSGHPLTDDDRAEWLVALGQRLQRADERPHILSCSALKAAYRELLRLGQPERLAFALLHGPREVLEARLLARDDHYMSADLLDSQLVALEIPEDSPHFDIRKSPTELVLDLQCEFFVKKSGNKS